MFLNSTTPYTPADALPLIRSALSPYSGFSPSTTSTTGSPLAHAFVAALPTVKYLIAYGHAVVSSAPCVTNPFPSAAPAVPSKPWLCTTPVVFFRVAAVCTAVAVDDSSVAVSRNQYRCPTARSDRFMTPWLSLTSYEVAAFG